MGSSLSSLLRSNGPSAARLPRGRRVSRVGCLLLVCAFATACGCGGGSWAQAYRTTASATSPLEAPTTVALAESRSGVSRGGGAPSFWGESHASESAVTGSAGDARSLADQASFRDHEQSLYAQAQRTTTPSLPTATDAVDTSGELLIYTALFHVGVYDIAASVASLAESARSVGGFVFSQSDDTIVVRVPAARFMAFTTQIDGSYDVLHRQIDAQDVGEEFRDVEIRIRNLEQMRDRVAALLASAANVDEALAVEQQLERITAQLESLRGHQRFLADRISFSTITVMFRPQPRDAIDQPEVFQLPFAWLEGLGLPNLLQLR